MNFNELFLQLEKVRVAVVGDLMLDTYWWGKVDRISPEAPVPVVTLGRKEHRIGGAGNVALNTSSLGCETTLFSVVGDDVDGELLLGLLQERHIDTKYIIKSEERITTNKIRVMSRSQQMIRLDSEITDDVRDEDERALLYNFASYVKRYQPTVVIFEDYNKGVLSPTLITEMIAVCKEHGVVTTVDPKRANFFTYKGVDIFKPNLKEVKEALNLISEDMNEATLRNIHAELHQTLQHKISLITLSEKGIFFQKGSSSKVAPSHVRNIADVSGAGDTVIAVASVIYAITKDIKLAAEMSNIAGGLVCEEIGTAAIGRVRLLQECKKLLVPVD
ncbi:rfaE bifunctional protein, domain I [Filimonas lacunae]|uniref:RfaE bifunctional protein, domain I n=1 Tax=Filimonas lacunae TaxID=477680 RepID=A0A173MLI0_9BACT|nr:PfkB family carbohydrate kinase [Filimonas lacunae]BAV08493.1 RfaE bifunctional protein [Filimonas lacunae]SIT34012.1 rfaE bifunctional protein, domain I [Filimonas lacunae]